MKVTLQNVLVFLTGADQEPPLGFPREPELMFLNSGDVLVTASTGATEAQLHWSGGGM